MIGYNNLSFYVIYNQADVMAAINAVRDLEETAFAAKPLDFEVR